MDGRWSHLQYLSILVGSHGIVLASPLNLVPQGPHLQFLSAHDPQWEGEMLFSQIDLVWRILIFPNKNPIMNFLEERVP